MATTRFISPRPQIFTYLALAILMAIVLAARRGRPRLAYAVLPLFPLWINFHAGAIAGLVILVVVAACDAAEARLRPSLSQSERSAMLAGARDLGLAAVGSALLTLASPYSWRIYQNLSATLGNSVAMTMDVEWASPDFHQGPGQLLELYAGLAVLVIAYSRERRSWAEIAVIVLLIHESLGSVRNVPLLAIVTAPFVARHARSALARAVRPAPGDNSIFFTERPAAGVCALLLVMMLVLCLDRAQNVLAHAPSSGSGLARVASASFCLRAFPYDACAFIEREGFPTAMRIYNSYDDGGFLIWRLPEFPVSADGRADVYFGVPLERVRAVSTLEYDWSSRIAPEHPDFVLLDVGQQQARLFLQSPAWALVYVDRPQIDAPEGGINNSFIFVRREPRYQALIDHCRRDCRACAQVRAAYPDYAAAG
jgi:hypothetical protein